ncbi:1-phosphofructokinase family hexose kinase [Corynebacterium pygosceleis]|uniref:1-phosphofructokinase family hexose kinase n=1 Tax=Corynebacterium pygosceleis TaxID=2800406 RepID=A0A9Q4C6U9_9CORY|nr:1-phosphofructokinase family hexose kinase [Corynebacterium pygosceleis]MCK7636867.1 1-phosphofructokinase family hexose kinase [Corynebacterium pygosceleis]MCK7674341.1 1-phosphofructokinase family hexose kinase [Corynebacterium pygosceleis]MCL0120361.1 1-phosphofructokinase family hexose kinase [Corynebacterium pygosceleis]MCX7443908.1 1-phosphofructokinase family hexose kinase [Corynebacterium pygosceleis]MCX7467620.1 1-phosphofructokinase family hexose kinase [Corynebacterium pygoscelei
MILTLTPNPSIDLSLSLPAPLQPGGVQRLTSVTQSPGGKGINVSHACHSAGVDTLALFPAPARGTFVKLMAETGVPYRVIAGGDSVRTNTTVTEPDGTTTKFNGPGNPLSASAVKAVEEALIIAAGAAEWVVLSGSLPPGAPHGWYQRLLGLVRDTFPDVPVAVDTSDGPLLELAERVRNGAPAPTMIKPNGYELGQITGVDGHLIEHLALEGDFSPAIDCAQQILRYGVQRVLVTLGAAGAALVTAEGSWTTPAHPIRPVSTVGAGDCTLAGYLMADARGAVPPVALAEAVALGSAAAGLPGTSIPEPGMVIPDSGLVRSYC